MDDTPLSTCLAQVHAQGEGAQARPLFDQKDGQPSRYYFVAKAPPVGSIIELRLADGENRVREEQFRVLAQPGSAAARLYKILKRQHINPYFSQAVRREVAELLRERHVDDPQLDDLEHLAFVTIDEEDSRDLDQALYIERDDEDLILYYALADAAHFIKPGSALFAEALQRGVSFYLPEHNVPMLPAELSEGLMSLNPQVLRRALVFKIRVDAQGIVQDSELLRARVRSRAKLSFTRVQIFVDHDPHHPYAERDFADSLRLLKDLGQRRQALAQQRDAVQFTRDEAEFVLSDDGQRLGIGRHPRNNVSLWNEQVSLLCNMEGARFLSSDAEESPVQAVYRVHAPPNARDLAGLKKNLDRLVEVRGLDPEIWQWRGPRIDAQDTAHESLATYLERLPHDASHQRLRQAIERQVLLINRRSSYSPEPGRHFALGVNPYSRFSSPMREIVGVFTHKEALEKLGLKHDSDEDRQVDEDLRAEVIRAANRSKDRQKQVEADILKIAAEDYFSPLLQRPYAERPSHQGTLLGLKSTRMYVRLDDPPIELKIYLDQLENDLQIALDPSPYGIELSSHGKVLLRTGDRVQLRCVGYDKKRGRWHFVPLGIAAADINKA